MLKARGQSCVFLIYNMLSQMMLRIMMKIWVVGGDPALISDTVAVLPSACMLMPCYAIFGTPSQYTISTTIVCLLLVRCWFLLVFFFK